MPAKLTDDEKVEIASKQLKQLELVLATRQTKMPRGSKDWNEEHDRIMAVRHVAYLLREYLSD